MKEGGVGLRERDLVNGTLVGDDFGDLDRDLERDSDRLGDSERERLLRGEGVLDLCLDLGGVLERDRDRDRGLGIRLTCGGL